MYSEPLEEWVGLFDEVLTDLYNRLSHRLAVRLRWNKGACIADAVKHEEVSWVRAIMANDSAPVPSNKLILTEKKCGWPVEPKLCDQFPIPDPSRRADAEFAPGRSAQDGRQRPKHNLHAMLGIHGLK